jgi:hypothetical protein
MKTLLSRSSFRAFAANLSRPPTLAATHAREIAFRQALTRHSSAGMQFRWWVCLQV